MRTLLLAVIALACSLAIAPAQSDLPSTQPQSLLSPDWCKEAIRVTEPGVSIVTVENDVVELRTETTPATPWAAQLVARLSDKVLGGEVLLVEAEFRAAAVDPDTGESAVRIVYQHAEPPYTVSDECVVQAGKQWTRYRLPLRVKPFAAEKPMQLAIQFGTCRQRVQIRGFAVKNIGKTATTGLRSPALTYAGRAPDAPWRAAAQQRIERIRKSDLTILVADKTGAPVEGAEVSLRLTKHAFPFGTAVTTSRILGETPDDTKYREILKQYFNAATFEWEMKWQPWEAGDAVAQAAHRRRTSSAVDFLKQSGFFVRGHCLVWPELSRLPPDVQRLVREKKAGELAKRVEAHIDRMTTMFAGRVDEWDVVNEPTFHTAIQGVLGDDILAGWFRRAHAIDPTATLALNDFAMLSYGALNESKIARTYAMVRALRADGAPVQVIGEQAHMDDVLVGPERVLHLFDRFAALDLPIRVTEFDVSVDDEQLQADYLRDFFTAAFSHPSVNGIVQWGFFERNHWRPNAALWRADWSRRPAGDAYVDLISRVWHTSTVGRTDSQGRFAVRGFNGQYALTIEHEGRKTTIERQLPAGGDEWIVKLP